MQLSPTVRQGLSQLWGKLTEPVASIQDVELRRKAHLLSMFLLIIIMLMALITITRLIIIPGYIEHSPQIVGFILLGSTYALSRTRHYQAAAALSVSIFPMVAFVIIVNQSSPNPTATLFFLILALLMGSILLSIKGTAILGLANVLIILLLPQFAPTAFPNFGSIITILVANLSAIVLAVIAMVHRNQVERDRQAALAESENKYRLLLEQAADGIFIADSTGHYTMVNPMGCQMLGYSPDEMLQLNMRDVIPAEDLAAVPLRFDELQAGETVISERRLQRKDGGLIPVEINAKMMEGGRLQAIVRDISRRRAIEEKLIESESRLSLIFENVTDLVALLSVEPGHQFRQIMVNKAVLKNTGFTAEQLIGKTVDQVFPEPQLSFGKAKLEEAIATKTTIQYELTYDLPDGRRIIEMRVTPVFDQAGCCTHLLTVSHDITQRKQAEE
ncbi:MAG TPA: PAS domain S-box protein, partial [Anaerolineae bacterium]|nr:PAS domain S-box protein [Anaerolineae bacterium]